MTAALESLVSPATRRDDESTPPFVDRRSAPTPGVSSRSLGYQKEAQRLLAMWRQVERDLKGADPTCDEAARLHDECDEPSGWQPQTVEGEIVGLELAGSAASIPALPTLWRDRAGADPRWVRPPHSRLGVRSAGSPERLPNRRQDEVSHVRDQGVKEPYRHKRSRRAGRRLNEGRPFRQRVGPRQCCEEYDRGENRADDRQPPGHGSSIPARRRRRPSCHT